MPNAQLRIDGSAAQLPATMAGLVEVAIRDARTLDHNTYFPFCREWHNAYHRNSSCRVCLAGSVIAGSLRITPDLSVDSASFDTRTESLLDALDMMRYGIWSKAHRLIYGNIASNDLREYLYALPQPARANFNGWDDFNAHLASLESMLPRLRGVDRATAKLIRQRS